MVVWTNTLVDPNLKASTKKKCQLKSGGGWIYLSLVIWYQPPTILNGTFCNPWDYPYRSSFWHSYSPKCPTQWWSRPGIEWPQTRQGKLPVMEMSWKVMANTMGSWRICCTQSFLWHGSTVNPAPFLGSSLVLLSFRSQHNLRDKKKRRKMPQKPEAISTFLAAHYSAYKRWLLTYEKMASISTKSPRSFLKHLCKISHICTFCQGADAPKDINTSNNSKWLMMHQSHCWRGQTWCQ